MAAYIQLHAYEYDELDELAKVCGDKPGCVVSYGRVCDVHVPSPQAGYRQDIELIWHELRHCFYGEYH